MAMQIVKVDLAGLQACFLGIHRLYNIILHKLFCYAMLRHVMTCYGIWIEVRSDND